MQEKRCQKPRFDNQISCPEGSLEACILSSLFQRRRESVCVLAETPKNLDALDAESNMQKSVSFAYNTKLECTLKDTLYTFAVNKEAKELQNEKVFVMFENKGFKKI